MSSLDHNSLPLSEERPKKHRTTMAAEGLPRLALTVDDVYKMVEAGILDEDERVELIDGELVPMSPKGNHHEVLKARLTVLLARTMPADVMFAQETTFRLSTTTYLEPDFVFYREEQPLADLRGDNALLVIEVADSSLSYDRGRKARLYASFGIRELWVVDAVKIATHVYLDPASDGYRTVGEKGRNEALEPQLIPGLQVTLGSLTLR
jgi:Uma2 family endonuclease